MIKGGHVSPAQPPPPDWPDGVRRADKNDPPAKQPSSSSLVVAFEPHERRASDALVLRGYLGRSDVFAKVLTFVEEELRDTPGLRSKLEALVPRKKLEAALPWRIYLSPRLDSYVDFFWRQVLAWRPERQSDRRDDGYTVWLRIRDENEVPYVYRVYETAVLGSPGAYVGGALVEDYMSRPDSANVVWAEQEYGSLMGKPSLRTCVG
jgi:hypothetical protein